MGFRRFLLTGGFRAVGVLHNVMGWRARSAHALVVTANGRLLLVRHSYSPNWCLPGGALKRNESPLAAIVRELREEIGLTAWGRIVSLWPDPPPEKLPASSMFVVEGAEYRFKPNLEIDRVGEFDLDAPLPADRPIAQKRLVDHWVAQRTRALPIA